MKAKILLTILLMSLIPIPSTTAQIPTAVVTIECYGSNLNLEYLYSISNASTPDKSIDYTPVIDDVYCEVSNPTAYIEKIEISTSTNFPTGLLSISELYVGGGQSENFTIFVTVDDDFLINYDFEQNYWFYVNASVVEINGLQPANQGTDTHAITQIGADGEPRCSNCFELLHILDESRIGMSIPTYSGDLYNGETWRSFNSNDAFFPNLDTPFSTAWTGLQFIDLNCPHCRQVASEDMVDWVDRFDPSNNSQGSPNVEITTIVSDLIPVDNYDFAVTDASDAASADSGDAMVYVAMDTGDDLSWSTVIVQMSANGGAYGECTTPGQTAGTACVVTDDGDGSWGFGEEVTVSEGSDDICASACTVQVKILDAASNKLIYESSEINVA